MKIYVFEKKLCFEFFLRNKLLYETKISFYEKSSEKNLLGKFFWNKKEIWIFLALVHYSVIT